MRLVGFGFMVTQARVLQGCDFPGGLEAFAPFFLAVPSGLTRGGSESFGKRCALAEASTALLWGAWCSRGAAVGGDEAPFEKDMQDVISG